MSENLSVRNKGGRDSQYEDFVRARKLYWMTEAAKLDRTTTPPKLGEINLDGDDSEFIVAADGPNGIVAIFEDSADVGWFYLYDSPKRRILRCTHVYNRSNVQVNAAGVDVLWSDSGETSGVAIWAEMRAFLGVSNGIEIRSPILSAETPGISAGQWPAGFKYALLRRSENSPQS